MSNRCLDNNNTVVGYIAFRELTTGSQNTAISVSALSNNIIGEHNTAIGPNALKEHHQMQNLKAIVAEQQKQIEILTTGLQKVSAQLAAASPSVGALEASKFATGRIRRGGPAPQIANNP